MRTWSGSRAATLSCERSGPESRRPPPGRAHTPGRQGSQHLPGPRRPHSPAPERSTPHRTLRRTSGSWRSNSTFRHPGNWHREGGTHVLVRCPLTHGRAHHAHRLPTPCPPSPGPRGHRPAPPQEPGRALAHPFRRFRRPELLRVGTPVGLHVLLQDDGRQLRRAGRGGHVRTHFPPGEATPTPGRPSTCGGAWRPVPGDLQTGPRAALPGERLTARRGGDAQVGPIGLGLPDGLPGPPGDPRSAQPGGRQTLEEQTSL